MMHNCINSLRSVERFDKPSIVTSLGNDGFSKTVNRGVRQAIDEGVDIIVLVNTDILFTDPVAKKIIKRFAEDDNLGVLGAKLYYPNGNIQHAGGWHIGDECGHHAYGKDEREVPWINTPAYMQFVTGALFAFRREVFEEQGGFDERFFMGFEDSTFCFRAWQNGWKVLYAPEVHAIHAEGATRGHVSPEKANKKALWKIKELESQQTFSTVCEGIDWSDLNHRVWVANGRFPEVLVNLRGALGDVIAMTAAIHAYKTLRPDHKIYVRTHYPEVFRGNPDVEYAAKDTTMYLGRIVDCSLERQMRPHVNQAETYFRPFGMRGSNLWDFMRPRLFSNSQDLEKFLFRAGLNSLPSKFAVIHAGVTHWRNRHYPETLYRRVVNRILEARIPSIIVGGKGDMLPDHHGILDFRGLTNIHELREIINRASVYIGPDSGPAWVAMSTDTPTVLLFSSTLPGNTLPPGYRGRSVVTAMGCAGCFHREKPPVYWLECPDNERYQCIHGFDGDEIAKIALEVKR